MRLQTCDRKGKPHDREQQEREITWFGLRDGLKLDGSAADEPGLSFLVAIAVPGLNNHRSATVSIDGIKIGSRSNVQCAMRYADWFLRCRRVPSLNK